MESEQTPRAAPADGPDLVFLSRDGRIRTDDLSVPNASGLNWSGLGRTGADQNCRSGRFMDGCGLPRMTAYARWTRDGDVGRPPRQPCRSALLAANKKSWRGACLPMNSLQSFARFLTAAVTDTALV
jgi:hypothetical protein